MPLKQRSDALLGKLNMAFWLAYKPMPANKRDQHDAIHAGTDRFILSVPIRKTWVHHQ